MPLLTLAELRVKYASLYWENIMGIGGLAGGTNSKHSCHFDITGRTWGVVSFLFLITKQNRMYLFMYIKK